MTASNTVSLPVARRVLPLPLAAAMCCIALTALGPNARAASTSLADNLTAPFENSVGITDVNWIAQGFATTSDAYVLTSITVPLAQNAVTSGTLGLYVFDATGVNGRPGSQVGGEIGTIDYSLLPTADNFGAITFDGGTSLEKTLAPSSNYFLVMKGLGVTGGHFQWVYTSSDTGVGFPSAYTFSDDGGATWNLPDYTLPQKMRIEASVVPEPSSTALVLAGLACGVPHLRWRRSK